MKLRWERGALADLDEIFSYIARDSRRAGAQLVSRIERLATRLATTPFLGRPTRKPRFFRFPVGKYLIIYEVAATDVVIHYVRHAARTNSQVHFGTK